jgi:hypothetical protein
MVLASPLFIALLSLPGIRQVSLFDTDTATHLPLDSSAKPSDLESDACLHPRLARLYALTLRDQVSDIVISQEHYTFVLRPLPGKSHTGLFLQVILDPAKADTEQVRVRLEALSHFMVPPVHYRAPS